ARQYPCIIHGRCQDRWADAKSIWDLLALVAVPGSELLLEAEGPKSEEALKSLAEQPVNHRANRQERTHVDPPAHFAKGLRTVDENRREGAATSLDHPEALPGS